MNLCCKCCIICCCVTSILIICSVITVILVFSNLSLVPSDYVSKVETGGDIEEKYLNMGIYDVNNYNEETDEPVKKYSFYYPNELKTNDKKYPVVVVSNGSGEIAKKIVPVLEHLASWGFIVLGNHDSVAATGISADLTLAHLLELNDDEESIFYGKVDTNNIGISGHSQGGVSIFDAISNQTLGNMYKCAVSLSPIGDEWKNLWKMNYDPSTINIPIMIFSSTVFDLINLEELQKIYNEIKTTKVLARRRDTSHNAMLYSSDGYVTAWFMHYLQNDYEAGQFFRGSNPELLNNTLYQDQQINISD